MSEINVAERKRQQSLKEKKQKFQKREQIVQKALADIVSKFINYMLTKYYPLLYFIYINIIFTV